MGQSINSYNSNSLLCCLVIEMNPKIQKVNLQNLDDMQISFSSSNPFENLEYFQAMEVSDSASEKTGWIPNHLGRIRKWKIK